MSAAKSTAQRQAAFRAARAAEGLTPVRGLYAPTERHAEVRAAVARLLKRKPPKVGL